MALPTKGRIIIETTVGDIDVELWAKETPKACRNLIALAMEGYYDGVIFHRVVPGFLVQTGDRTGTGAGGESFYGEPFEDEIHPRLRFAHRGLVAMANSGSKNSNDSQFIITLDRADELHGKHTLFGRVMGDTIYNVAKIGEMELKGERPVYPPKIRTIRIVDNPFDDIVPRITAAEKRAQQRAREEGQRNREEAERRKGAKKDVKLLSFGADEEEGEQAEPVSFKKKGIARPDLLDNPNPVIDVPDFVSQQPRTQPKSKVEGSEKTKESKTASKKTTESVEITKIREKHAKEQSSSATARQTEIERMEAEIRKLSKRREGAGSDDSDDERAKKKPKRSFLEEEMAKYTKGKAGKKGGRKKDEGDILAALNSFRGRLKETMAIDDEENGDVVGTEEKDRDVVMSSGVNQGEDTESSSVTGTGITAGEDNGIEVDSDFGFLSHRLRFPKDDGEETIKADRDYEVIDPRQRGARAKEEERERKKREQSGRRKGGGRR